MTLGAGTPATGPGTRVTLTGCGFTEKASPVRTSESTIKRVGASPTEAGTRAAAAATWSRQLALWHGQSQRRALLHGRLSKRGGGEHHPSPRALHQGATE